MKLNRQQGELKEKTNRLSNPTKTKEPSSLPPPHTIWHNYFLSISLFFSFYFLSVITTRFSINFKFKYSNREKEKWEWFLSLFFSFSFFPSFSGSTDSLENYNTMTLHISSYQKYHNCHYYFKSGGGIIIVFLVFILIRLSLRELQKREEKAHLENCRKSRFFFACDFFKNFTNSQTMMKTWKSINNKSFHTHEKATKTDLNFQ